jgi:hypothetical protein
MTARTTLTMEDTMITDYDWPLTAPLLAVVPHDVLDHEPTPAYDEAIATPAGSNFLALMSGALRDPHTPTLDDLPWKAGQRVTCLTCRREVGRARDGRPVRHKFGGAWCTT